MDHCAKPECVAAAKAERRTTKPEETAEEYWAAVRATMPRYFYNRIRPQTRCCFCNEELKWDIVAQSDA